MDKAACEPKGIIFNVQQFSLHDGPGIRTIVFLKGCSLRCFWCCNPESQHPEPEISRNASKCLGAWQCGKCLDTCPNSAFTTDGTGIFLNRQQCSRCGACAATCPTSAMAVLGNWVTVKEVLTRIQQDAVFYTYSGGGVTIGGGEPLLQPAFTEALCKGAQELGLETALETCAHVPYASLRQVGRVLDYLLVDLKTMDSKAHKRATGAPNGTILRNIRRFRQDFPALPITVRMPIIPGFNDTRDEVRSVACFVTGLKGAALELLPYHRLGEGKYENLGRSYAFPNRPSPSRECMEELKREAAVVHGVSAVEPLRGKRKFGGRLSRRV